MAELTRRERERQTREAEIIAAAEKVFILKGYEDSLMDEIAKEAQYTKRTLYQYFENKDELYLAVALKVFKQFRASIQIAYDEKGSGYTKIEKICTVFYRFFKENPGTLQLIKSIGKAKRKSNEDTTRRQEFLMFNEELFNMIAAIITHGQGDGSIKPGLDPQKTAYSLVFLMTGYLYLFSYTGENFTENFSLDKDEFSEFTFGLVLAMLKNN